MNKKRVMQIYTDNRKTLRVNINITFVYFVFSGELCFWNLRKNKNFIFYFCVVYT